MYKFLFLILFFFSFSVKARDSLKNSVDISVSAMKAQSRRLEVISENMANIDSTGLTPNELPYRRKVISFKSKYDPKTGANKIKVKEISHDKSEFIKKYEPYHPASDKDGYVLYPNINIIIETTDAREAERAYQANLNAISVARNMTSKTLDILR